MQVVESDTEVLHTKETQGTTMGRCATNGVDECCLDELVQRKCVKNPHGPMVATSGWTL